MLHRRMLKASLVTICALAAVAAIAAVGQTQGTAKVDLMTASGVGQFKAQWRYSDATIVNVTSAATDKTIAEWTEAQMKGGGGYRPTPPAPPRMTYDIQPKAGAADFDDSSWGIIAPETLPMYRSGGQLCFGWYRTTLTMPERVDGFATAGTKAFLLVNADDYGEVWVNGQLPRSLRGPSPHVIGGWNTTMRVPLTTAVKPGEKIQVAVFVINGPISDTPTNRLFIRSAAIEFAQ